MKVRKIEVNSIPSECNKCVFFKVKKLNPLKRFFKPLLCIEEPDFTYSCELTHELIESDHSYEIEDISHIREKCPMEVVLNSKKDKIMSAIEWLKEVNSTKPRFAEMKSLVLSCLNEYLKDVLQNESEKN